MKRAISSWLRQQQSSGHVFQTDESLEELADNLSLSYTIYGRCMLLLPGHAFTKGRWQEFRVNNVLSQAESLYELLSKNMHITHIAINQPIPPQSADEDKPNRIRAPINFNTIYGDFGSSSCESPPSQIDLRRAFWVTEKQNGIYQTWAPRWTMFSRGNVSEKARLLQLPSVTKAVEQGRQDGRGCAVVDLYAGIGYFAFSYLKAGVHRVLCWDINPWSIEGLKRGAVTNKWQTTTYIEGSGSLLDITASDARVLIFPESNINAMNRIRTIRAQLPPIRHVNCGLLPTSTDSWSTALDAIDPTLGGWIHVHENFGVAEITTLAKQVRNTLENMAASQSPRNVQLESVYHVKSYAPGVMHCVIDILVGPANPA